MARETGVVSGSGSDQDRLRRIPSIEKLVTSSRLKAWEGKLSHSVRVRVAQGLVAGLKRRLMAEATSLVTAEQIENELEEAYGSLFRRRLKRIVNATGIVLHTNLGRAPLPREALESMVHTLSGYCTLEFDTETAGRGSRTELVEELICLLTGAEAAVAVNNNAAGCLLALSSLAKGKRVIVSRGELVQIGGGFRVPEILQMSGCELVEAGTTNITELGDYQRAAESYSGGVAAVLKVHQSCFAMVGHSETVGIPPLSVLCKDRGIPLVLDLGGGAMRQNLSEPTVADSVREGADLVAFSADKLMGGPQAGFVVGKAEWVKRLKSSPLYRALRLGKTEIFLLEEILMRHLAGEKTPTDLLADLSDRSLKERAEHLVTELGLRGVAARLEAGVSRVGGGTTPTLELPTWLVHLDSQATESLSRRLLESSPPILTRREGGRLALDLRTVFPEDEAPLLAGITAAFRGLECSS